MKLKTTLLLILLNIVVFFFLFRQESPFDLRDKISKDTTGILPYPMVEATQIEVTGSQVEQPYKLLRTEDYWMLDEPIKWAANPFAVRRMISRLESTDASVNFPVSEIRSREQSLEDFGLETPNFIIRITFGSEQYEYAFGAPVEIGDRLYLLSPSKEDILVVKANIIQPFLIALDDLRSKQLISIPEFEIQSLLVEFNDDGTRRRFTRRDGEWMIDSPFLAKANGGRVQSAIDQLINFDVQIVGTNVGDQVEVNHFNSFARFEVIGNRRNATMLVSQYMINGEVNPDFLRGRLEGTDTIFLIPRTEIDWWRTSQNRLRERQILGFDIEGVSKLEILDNGDPSSGVRILKLENQNWKLYAGSQTASVVDFAVDSAKVISTLTQLKGLIALNFITDTPSAGDLEAFGLVDPKRLITIEGQTTIKLRIGETAEDGQGVYVKLDQSPSVYLVAGEVLDLISSTPLDYRQRRISLMDGATYLTYFVIEDLETGDSIHNKSLEDLVSTAKQQIDLEDAQALEASLLVLLREFSVAGYVDSAYNAEGIEFEGEKLKWRFRLTFYEDKEGTKKVGELLLTKRISGSGQLAYLPGKDLVVMLNQDLIDVLHPMLFDIEIPEEYRPPALESPSESEDTVETEVDVPLENPGVE
jgi:hypothetical protein